LKGTGLQPAENFPLSEEGYPSVAKQAAENLKRNEGYGLPRRSEHQPVDKKHNPRTLYRLRKNSGFVSGHDFSRAVNA
jgi:hypothetical protein